MKFRIALAALVLVAAALFNSAPRAQALGWSSLVNQSSRGYAILVSTTDPYQFAFNLWAPNRTDRASCFRVSENMHSAYGGNYYVGTTRCFASSGNFLVLYSGLA